MVCRHSHRYFCVCQSLGLTKTTLTKIVAKSEVREAVGLWLCLPKQLLSGSGKEGFCFFLFCSVLFFLLLFLFFVFCFFVFASGLENDWWLFCGISGFSFSQKMVPPSQDKELGWTLPAALSRKWLPMVLEQHQVIAPAFDSNSVDLISWASFSPAQGIHYLAQRGWPG